MSPATLVVLLLATVSAGKRGPDFEHAVAAFRAGDYDKAARAFASLGEALPKNRDYTLYFLGESQFYAGAYAKAEATFVDLGKQHDSRFAGTAPARVADCLWMQGRHDEAAKAYRKLLSGKGNFDAAVARFRIADVDADAAEKAAAGSSAREAAARTFLQIHVDFPGHPLGVEAGRRAALLAPPVGSKQATVAVTPAERLQRAATLAKSRRWQEALDELALLPEKLPQDQATERDLAIGMAKYNARRDYAGAAALLLDVATKLTGEKASFAMFHGARSLSRIDRDDDAIANYRLLVATYPHSSWAPEAQFRSGWLEINRGHFREALPALRETLARYPKSAFADDAAWYLAFAHYLLGEAPEALKAIATYAEVVRPSNDDGAMRARYWRARILALAGQHDQAKTLLRECVAHAPYNFYGLLARARLRELGEKPAWPKLSPRPREPAPLRDPAVLRALDLDRVGLQSEAGFELERSEESILKRNGKRAIPFLLATYPRLLAFHRGYKLAEATGENALGDSARLYWEASYARAFADSTKAYNASLGSPELFVYAIMRKESGYLPFAVSASDARGLLQLIPTTAAEVAKKLDLEFYPDQLFDPDTNVHLGVAYLGSLLRRFAGQEALAAGAYNAGAHAMMRWCDQWPGRPLDEFVELITYDQAREYIKRVLANYAHYRHLYAQPLELSLSVNTHYTKDGDAF
jgi:soluble lytic murein transglycosylase